MKNEYNERIKINENYFFLNKKKLFWFKNVVFFFLNCENKIDRDWNPHRRGKNF